MIIFLIIIFILLYCFYKLNLEVKYVESLIDSKNYLVRDLPDAQTASDMLSKLKSSNSLWPVIINTASEPATASEIEFSILCPKIVSDLKYGS